MKELSSIKSTKVQGGATDGSAPMTLALIKDQKGRAFAEDGRPLGQSTPPLKEAKQSGIPLKETPTGSF